MEIIAEPTLTMIVIAMVATAALAIAVIALQKNG